MATPDMNGTGAKTGSYATDKAIIEALEGTAKLTWGQKKDTLTIQMTDGLTLTVHKVEGNGHCLFQVFKFMHSTNTQQTSCVFVWNVKFAFCSVLFTCSTQ